MCAAAFSAACLENGTKNSLGFYYTRAGNVCGKFTELHRSTLLALCFTLMLFSFINEREREQNFREVPRVNLGRRLCCLRKISEEKSDLECIVSD